MKNAEIFNIATWNFLAGDRAVEDTIKDKRISTIIVRGGTGTVLPTIAGIRDISELGWKEPVAGKIYIPFNALSSHKPDLLKKIEEDKTYETLLSQSYGVRLLKSYEYFPDQVILIMNMTEENKIAKAISPSVLNILKNIKDEKIIFTCPRNQKILPEFRKYALKAWSTIYWNGLNAFFSSSVEEAIREANPQKILVLGAKDEHVFYTAIGAVDYFIIEDSQFRDPETLKLWDLIDLGKKVSVLYGSGNGKKETLPLKDLLTKHLLEILKVDSISEDYQYSKIPDHKIMIDII